MFLSLDTISVDRNSLEASIAFKNQMNTLCEPGALLPILRDLNSIIGSSDYGSSQPVDKILLLEKFVLLRIQNDQPISRLNIEDTLPFNSQCNLDLTTQIENIEVLYTCSPAGNN